MKNLSKGLVSLALLAAAFSVGCGSSAGTDDAGAAGSTGTAGTGAGGAAGTGDVCQGVTPFGLSAGDNCFDITAVMPGSNDGCMLGVADTTAMNGLVGASLLVNYDAATGTLTVGTMGSLGAGPIMCNAGTLNRDNNPTLSSDPSCTWHQTDASMVTITNTNEFDIAVTENETSFMSCTTADMPPAGGMCTSTWTWHMAKSATKTPPCQ